VLELFAERVGAENLLLSLMSQYTPDFYIESERECGEREGCRSLRRKVTSFEYDSVVKVAQRLGFEGYFQSRSSADRSYTPDF
jgi:putative pyruvate formate lyase activating enzyme